MIADFNNDGLDDMAIGDSFHEGNAGLFWQVFLGQLEGGYRFLGKLFFHPESFKLEPLEGGRVHFYAYHHMGWDEGLIQEYIISASGIDQFRSRPVKTETNEADKEEFGRLFRTVLKNNSREEHCYLREFLNNIDTSWIKTPDRAGK
jgi:hypothetical protein